MSHIATTWAVSVRGIPATAKVVLWHLADRHNKDSGRCDPSQDLLASDCEISRSSLNNQLNALEKAGLIKRIQRSNGKTKRKKTTHYILMFDVFEPQNVESRVQNLDKEAVSKSEAEPCPNLSESRVQNLDINLVKEPGKEPYACAREREAAPSAPPALPPDRRQAGLVDEKTQNIIAELTRKAAGHGKGIERRPNRFSDQRA